MKLFLLITLSLQILVSCSKVEYTSLIGLMRIPGNGVGGALCNSPRGIGTFELTIE